MGVWYYTDAMSEPLTIAAAAPLIRSGELTPSELLEQCLRRIDIYEPAVQAWVYLDRERARRDAARLTDEAKAGRVRGPLHGVPVGVKDIIDVFDMPTGCGSKLWANSYARRDATVVERLRQAGAVILGKTVTTPYAYLDPPPTRNPWDLTRTPGGSSSGSAAAVACGMCLAALGTQTGGSTTRPAAYCGIASLKASYAQVSGDGVLELAGHLDHVGLLARTLSDLAAVYTVVAGADYHDANPFVPVDDLVGVLSLQEAEAFPTIHQLGRVFDADAVPDVRAAMAEAADRIRERVNVASAAPPAGFDVLPTHNAAVYAAQAALNHADRFERHPDDYPPRITQLVRDGLAVSSQTLLAGLRFRRAMRRNVSMLLDRTTFLTPAAPDVPPGPDSTGSPAFNSPWTFLGLPVVSLPAGRTADGLPFAVQLVGGFRGEAGLFVHARRVEAALGFAHRLPPVPA